MIFKIKKYEKFQIIGRGIILSMNRTENEIEGISIGSTIILDDNSQWEVTGIEQTKDINGNTKNIGVLIKEIK